MTHQNPRSIIKRNNELSKGIFTKRTDDKGGKRMKYIRQYFGMRKELYILFWGRVVTNMGALIWPMMTLILKNKLGYSASQIASILILLGIAQLPCTLIGGKLADRFNKRNLIIICDMVTVISYFICAFLPMSEKVIPLLALAAIFAQMEWPSYDALVADLSSVEDRERAYSLNYLGVNLGLVLAPTIGGFLFAKHLSLAFLISSVATFSSTVLIFLFIKDITPVKTQEVSGQYEEVREGHSIWQVLWENKLLMLFMLCGGIWMLVYNQFNFLLPLNLEQSYGEQGAVLFGTLTSVNAFVVIVGTPILTRVMVRIRDVERLLIGQILIVIGFSAYIFIQNVLVVWFVSMIVFTLGEICETLGRQPYLTRRIPASHRGRFSSFYTVFAGTFQLGGQKVVGSMADMMSMQNVWLFIVIIGVMNVVGYYILRQKDRKAFSLLYK